MYSCCAPIIGKAGRLGPNTNKDETQGCGLRSALASQQSLIQVDVSNRVGSPMEAETWRFCLIFSGLIIKDN